MFDKLATNRVPEALFRADAQAHRCFELHAAESPTRPRDVTIAISREAGARGDTVAAAVGKRLGWAVYDHELVERIAGEMKTGISLLDRIDERHRTWVQECIDSFFMGRSVPETAYVRQLVETLTSLAAVGKCIVVGRGAAHVLPAESTLRVRIVAPMNDRIWIVMREHGLSYGAAHKYLVETESARTEFIRDHFFVDPADPHNYDLVINSSRCSTSECVDLIVDALRPMHHAGDFADADLEQQMEPEWMLSTG